MPQDRTRPYTQSETLQGGLPVSSLNSMLKRRGWGVLAQLNRKSFPPPRLAKRLKINALRLLGATGMSSPLKNLRVRHNRRVLRAKYSGSLEHLAAPAAEVINESV